MTILYLTGFLFPFVSLIPLLAIIIYNMVTLIKSPLMYLILRLLILSDYIVNNLVYNYSPFESYISSISS